MLKTIQMQQRREPRPDDWREIKLRESNPAAAIGAKAKRGDLIVYPLERNVVYASYLHPSERSTEYTLALVTGITRDGAVAKYRSVGIAGLNSYDEKGRPAQLWLIGQDRLSMPAREVIERYIARHEWDRDFKSLDEAKEFLRGFLK